MRKILTAFALLVFCFAAEGFAQRTNAQNEFEFTGTLKDKNSDVFAGVRVFINKAGKETAVTTDINGKFNSWLAPGNYEITVSRSLSETFKAFVVIQANGLNPNNVEFVIEPKPIFCGATFENKPCPKITKFAKPPYPAAARAVRATGEVVVEVKIDKEGKVVEASAVSGHPLLRGASMTAAKQSLFEASESEETREVKLTFVFFLQSGNEKENSKRYSNLYRVEVISVIEIINNTIDNRKS